MNEHEYSFDDAIPLKVVRGDVDMSPDVNVNVTSLNSGVKYFQNNSGDGDSFRIKVVVHQEDMVTGNWSQYFNPSYQPQGGYIDHFTYYDDLSVAGVLDYCIRNGKTLMVTSDNRRAVDIPDGIYIITANSSRKQSYDAGFSIWDLEFTRFIPGATTRYKVNTGAAQDAVKAYNKQKNKNKNKSTSKKTTTKTTKAKQSSSLNSKLGKCSLKNLKYSKTKKVTDCVKTLQKYLNKKNGCNLAVDGWYGDATKKQVKKFQTNYKKKYKLNPTGNMDKATLNAMTKV